MFAFIHLKSVKRLKVRKLADLLTIPATLAFGGYNVDVSVIKKFCDYLERSIIYCLLKK